MNHHWAGHFYPKRPKKANTNHFSPKTAPSLDPVSFDNAAGRCVVSYGMACTIEPPAAASLDLTISDAQRIQNAHGDWQTWYIGTPWREQRFASAIESIGGESYVPLRKTKDGYAPAFPHYIFSTLDRCTIHDIAESLRVGRPTRHAYHAKYLRIELTNLAMVLEHNPRLNGTQSMRVGTKVEVIRGPWRGLKGTVRTMPDELDDEQRMLLIPIGLGFVQLIQFSRDDLDIVD